MMAVSSLDGRSTFHVDSKRGPKKGLFNVMEEQCNSNEAPVFKTRR
jgi:hypothetical protein